MSHQNPQEFHNKIKSLEQINQRLIEEYEALNRNYEAICIKLREEKNISRRLQDSMTLSQSKEKNEELIIQLNTYKEKYERLADSISGLESRLKSASQNNIKYQENELNYKKNIKILEEKLKKNSDNFLNTKKIEKKNEEKIGLYRLENQKLEEEILNLRKKNEEINKKIIETNKIYEQMKKENEIIYKLLDESRKKIRENEKAFEFLKEKFKDKNNNKINEKDKYKELYDKTLIEIDNLKKENEILKSENEFYQGMNQMNKQSNIKDITNSNKKLIIYNIKENNINYNSNINFNDFIKNIFISQNEKISECDNKIEQKMRTLEEKFDNIKKIISTNISNLINKLKNNANNNDDKIISENLRLKLEISKLNSDIKKYENKLSKKKYKKIKLLEEIKNLNIKINFYIEKGKTSVELSEIKKQFKYINDIIQRLQLTMETFCINLKCKTCYKVKVKMYQLPCGHSICEECTKLENKCIECENKFSSENIYENKFLTNVIARYNYAEQQINSDLELVIQTLKKYLT